MEIPRKFKDQFGKEVTYQRGDDKVCNGIVKDARFSRSFIMNMETFEKNYGIELKIKPNDGFNLNRSIWTTAFDSGIPMEDDEF